MKNYDVVALGELLVDFTQNGISAQGNWLMEANAGGCSVQCSCDACKTRASGFICWKSWRRYVWKNAPVKNYKPRNRN